MAIGYASNGVDFDDIFQSKNGTKRADVGYANGGVDISNNYESISYGSPAANTEYHDNGVDLGQRFSAINTTIIPATIPDVTASAISPAPATAGIRFNSDRNIDRQINDGYLTVDQWALSLATVSIFEVRFVAVSGDTGSLVGADSVWRVLSSNREVSLTASAGAGSLLSATVRAEWRKTGETLAFSDTFTLQASQS